MTLPVTIPNEFANETTPVELVKLDENFTALSDAVNEINGGLVPLQGSQLTISGNVGIGTSAPFNKLDIASAGSSQITVKDGVNVAARYDFGRDGTDGFFAFNGLQTTFSGYRWAINNGAEVMRITNGGNVGIGTSAPGAKLEIANGNNNLRLSRSNDSTQTNYISGQGAGGVTQFYFGQLGAGTDLFVSNLMASPIIFSAGGSERLRIDASGNVGIGNAAASVSDQVGGIRPLLVSRGDAATTIAGSLASIVIGNTNTTANNSAQLSFAALTGASGTYFASGAINCVFGARTNGQYPTGQLVFSTSTVLNTAPTEKMRIHSSGNVSIGTAALTTTATDGFLYIPTCPGTPTGAPTAITGLAPIVVNSTNNKLYFYSGGAWRDAGP